MSPDLLRSRERRAELGWAAFCVACAAGMLVFPQWQTVPFHLIWITITLLYGYRRWSALQTGLTLLAVIGARWRFRRWREPRAKTISPPSRINSASPFASPISF